jgi:hypothetical protein
MRRKEIVGPIPPEVIEKFFLKVVKDKPFFEPGHGMSPCWNWMGAVDVSTNGKMYGRFAWNKRAVPSHRFSFYLHNQIDPPYDLDHLCKNTLCVNPQHLEAVSHSENMKRIYPAKKIVCVNGHPYTEINTGKNSVTGRRYCKVCDIEGQRRRYPKKYQAYKEKYNKIEQVKMIDFNASPKLSIEKARDIRKHHSDGMSMRAIARLYDVSPPMIRLIINNKSWKEESS